MSTTTLPHSEPNDERSGVETLFAGLAIPYILGALMICAGLVVGGTLGSIIAYGSLMVLLIAVFVGILRFVGTDDEA